MACLGTGKIRESIGLRDALELIRSKSHVRHGVLRIMSKEASGRIVVRGGWSIVGAQITAGGLTGYPALKRFLALKRGMFYYLDGEDAGGRAVLDQDLGVDIGRLLTGQSGKDLLQQFSALAEEQGWDTGVAVVDNQRSSAVAATTGPVTTLTGAGADEQATASDRLPEPVKAIWQRVSAMGPMIIMFGLCVVGYSVFRTSLYTYTGDEYMHRAENYLQQGKRDQAIDELSSGLKKNPSDLKLLKLRGLAYESKADYQLALADYDAVVAVQADDVRTALHSATIRCRIGKFAEALALTQKLLERMPNDDESLALQGLALTGLGRYKEGLETLSRIPDDRQLAPYLVACVNGTRGFDYLKTGDPQNAVPYYQKAIKAQPDNDSLHRELAQCWQQLHQAASASSELRKAAELAPGNAGKPVVVPRVPTANH